MGGGGVAKLGSDTQPLAVEDFPTVSLPGLSLSEVSLGILLEPDTKTLTVLVGEPATLRCSVTGGDLKNYQVSWYKKTEDSSLILAYRPSNNTNEDSRSNFKGNTNASKSQLDIQRTTVEDAGTYYCACDIHGAPVLLLVAPEPLGQTEVAGLIRGRLWLKCAPYPS